jgi:hypothetical protein
MLLQRIEDMKNSATAQKQHFDAAASAAAAELDTATRRAVSAEQQFSALKATLDAAQVFDVSEFIIRHIMQIFLLSERCISG